VAPPLVAFALALLALVLLAVSGPSYQLGLVSLPSALAVFRSAAFLGLVSALATIVAFAHAIRRRHLAAGLITLLAGAGSIVAIAIPVEWWRAAQAAPPIHDISTDLENPPAFTAILPLRQPTQNSLERSAAVTAEQRSSYPDIHPVSLPIPPDQAFEETLELIQEHEWEVVSADKERGVLEAIATSPWFGFKDDVVIRLTASGTGTRVDMRSASRIGVGDVGANAERVREFLDDLEHGQ
jgi:uncharacterized protein (DUF1499 family)